VEGVADQALGSPIEARQGGAQKRKAGASGSSSLPIMIVALPPTSKSDAQSLEDTDTVVND